ncbi:MAG: hypothetical protein AB7U83_10240 [Vicinamibacterales bacterium]
MRVPQLTKKAGLVAVLAAALGAAACGDVARTGRSPGYLILDRLEGANGAEPDQFSTFVPSDVITLVRQTIDGREVRVPTAFVDPGRVTLRVGLKNPGPSVSPTSPGPLNAITITRYRVVYKRTDGRNTQGVDVPYAFDGGMSLTVPEDQPAVGFFELVRIIAKNENPLVRLISRGGVDQFAAIADVTFYGRDQAGNDVSVTGSISITFADWGDPE